MVLERGEKHYSQLMCRFGLLETVFSEGESAGLVTLIIVADSLLVLIHKYTYCSLLNKVLKHKLLRKKKNLKIKSTVNTQLFFLVWFDLLYFPYPDPHLFHLL